LLAVHPDRSKISVPLNAAKLDVDIRWYPRTHQWLAMASAKWSVGAPPDSRFLSDALGYYALRSARPTGTLERIEHGIG